MLIRLVDPRHEAAREAAPPAERLTSLAGKTVALVDISKPGGSIFLDRLATRLVSDHGVSQVLRLMKPTFTKRAPEALIEQLRPADAVVLALAD